MEKQPEEPASQADEFADIPEFGQYGGKFPLLTPTYDKKCNRAHDADIVSFEKLKTLIKNGEYSARTNRLANIVVRELPSNYNGWEAKRRCLDGGVTNIQEELEFTEEVLEDTVKNFQGWEFRRYLIQLRGDPAGEIEFLERMLLEDHKNYHLWTYRVWLCQRFALYEQELALIGGWIDRDVMNNTAWTYRHFLLRHLQLTEEQFTAELNYIFDKVRLEPDNEAAWNYLRGWFPSIQLKNFPCKSPAEVKSYCTYPTILERVLTLVKEQPKLLQPYITIVHIYSETQTEQPKEGHAHPKEICELLAQRQKQKSNYWRWVAANL